MPKRLLLLCLVFTALADCPAFVSRLVAEPTAAELPPPRTEYYGRRIARTMHYTGAPWLVRESRNREEEPQKLLDALAVKPGQLICDMGCGNGFYAVKLAQRVGPKGTIFAVDIQPEMLDQLEVRAKRYGVRNIRPTLGTVVDPKLPAGKLDLVLMVDVYHEFSHPETMLRAIRKSLKADGRLVFVEFREEDPDVPIKPLHKMSKRQIIKEATANGFKLVSQFDELPWQHVMTFVPSEKRPPEPASNGE